MAERKVHKGDGTVETLDVKRFHVGPAKPRVPWSFREVVELNDRDFEITKHFWAQYDEVPGVESGLDDDGLLFSRVGRFMMVGIEHWFRYIHLFRQVKAGATVLDAACGYGELGKLLYTERYKCKYVGMDIAPQKLRAATKLGWGSSETMFIQRDLSRPLPFNNATFDVVVSTEFIEHVMKPHAMAFLHEVFRVMKPGGRLVLTTPNNDWGEVDPVHPNEYGYQETLDMMAEIGFKVTEQYGLKLRGNVREWDKHFADDPNWAAMRGAYPPIFAKCMMAANHPSESVFWSLVAERPKIVRTKV